MEAAVIQIHVLNGKCVGHRFHSPFIISLAIREEQKLMSSTSASRIIARRIRLLSVKARKRLLIHVQRQRAARIRQPGDLFHRAGGIHQRRRLDNAPDGQNNARQNARYGRRQQ